MAKIKHPMSRTLYSYDVAFAALCIIEEIVAPVLPNASQPWQDYRDQVGINELRDCVLHQLAGPCNDAWECAQKRHEEVCRQFAYDSSYAKQVGGNPPEEPGDPGSFDYEFVPVWLRDCVDWSDVGRGPRVRGSKA